MFADPPCCSPWRRSLVLGETYLTWELRGVNGRRAQDDQAVPQDCCW